MSNYTTFHKTIPWITTINCVEHEKKYGPLHRYGTSSRDKELESWRNSTKYEHELYCNITKRIQYALEALEKESINDGSHLVECSYERLQKNIEATKNYD